MKRDSLGTREDYLITEDIRYVDLRPHVLGHHICHPRHDNRPVLSTKVLIHYVLCGKGIFVDKHGRRTQVGAGEIFMILPEEAAYYRADDEDPWEYIWVIFSGEMTKRLACLPERVFPWKDGALFNDLLMRARSNTLTSDYFVSRLFLLYSELLATQSYGRRYEEEVAHYIEMYYMRELSVAELSTMVHLDRSYLTRIFTRAYRMSPKQYLLDVRMRRAAEMLLEGRSVSFAAQAVGYQDVSAFSKAFKGKMACSPRQYIKTNRERG